MNSGGTTLAPNPLTKGGYDMIGESFVCARTDCDVVGTKTTHNQKFCSTDCCRVATNRKIMERYHEKVAIKRGKKRVCSNCGITKLSRYNTGNECSQCESKDRERFQTKVSDIAAALSA